MKFPCPKVDIAGEDALRLLEAEYMMEYAKAYTSSYEPERVRDMREAICLARGWEFKP